MKQKKQRRTLSIMAMVCAALLAAAWLCGCSAQQADSARQLQPIVVGCDNYAPYTYIETNGDYGGVDVELAQEAFRRMGYEPQFQQIQWEEKDNLLHSGSVDCLWSCFTMTGREEQYQWAGPYLYSNQVVAVRADSDIHTLADLAGRRVGVQATTKAESIFLQRTDPRIPQVGRLYSCSTSGELQAMLRKGYVDAIAGHEEGLSEVLGRESGYRILSESLYISQLGVAFEKGTHAEFAAELTCTLNEMKQDGTVARIAEKYGLDPEMAVQGGSAS